MQNKSALSGAAASSHEGGLTSVLQPRAGIEKWCRAPPAVSNLWAAAGVTTPIDLAGYYTSQAEVDLDFAYGFTETVRKQATAAWRDALTVAGTRPTTAAKRRPGTTSVRAPPVGMPTLRAGLRVRALGGASNP